MTMKNNMAMKSKPQFCAGDVGDVPAGCMCA